MNQRKLPELLCPAGDLAALRAAVDCGADAVYLGYKAYGARASAVNFDDEALSAGIRYAHLHRARVYVTVNTLAKERELAGVREALGVMEALGADAALIQDLGVAMLARDEFPGLRLHASTQMALSNASDAVFAREFGFSRVVLARECTLSQVRQVVETGIEAEVFAHGALCCGVSGRCLLSSMAGGRSGNRGRCAQPCRMEFRLGDRKGALLSLRDLCTWQDLPALCDLGVSSLKLEGRLKSPEYVAVVTDVYRRALDAIAAGRFAPDDPAPKERLLQIFNRGGFTRGHLLNAQDGDLWSPDRVGHEGLPLGQALSQSGQLAKLRVERDLHDGDTLQLRGEREEDLRYAGREVKAGEIATLRLRPGMRITPGDPVARLSDARQLSAAREHRQKSISITMEASFQAGKPMALSLSDGQTRVTVTGDLACAAKSRAATREDAARQLSKLGDTPFALDNLAIQMDDGLFLPVSALNALRRDGLEKLCDARIAAFRLPPRASQAQAPGVNALPVPVCEGTLAACFGEPSMAGPLLESGANLLLFRPWDYRREAVESALALLPPGTWLRLPAQLSQEALLDLAQAVRGAGSRLGGVMAGSLGQLNLFPALPVIAGEEIPVTNGAAVNALEKTRAGAFVLWPEWTGEEQREFLPARLPALLKVYGRETLMLLNHCPARALKGLNAHREVCALCQGPEMACGMENAALRDQKGYAFPLRRALMPEGCMLNLLNALPTDLRAFDGERRALGAGMLLSFTTETKEEQLVLTRSFAALKNGGALPKAENSTAGHWRRGVE